MPPLEPTKAVSKTHPNDQTTTSLQMPDATVTPTTIQTAQRARAGYQADGQTPIVTPKP